MLENARDPLDRMNRKRDACVYKYCHYVLQHRVGTIKDSMCMCLCHVIAGQCYTGQILWILWVCVAGWHAVVSVEEAREDENKLKHREKWRGRKTNIWCFHCWKTRRLEVVFWCILQKRQHLVVYPDLNWGKKKVELTHILSKQVWMLATKKNKHSSLNGKRKNTLFPHWKGFFFSIKELYIHL